MVETAKIIWADGPTSTPHEPDKAQIRAWGSWLEESLAITAQLLSASVARATKAELDAVVASYNDGDIGLVVLDDDLDLRGVYVKTSGVWVKKADLPNEAAQASEAALMEFRSRYLGGFAADPNVDPFGNPLIEGALYLNTMTGTLRTFHDGSWQNQTVTLDDGDVTVPKLAGDVLLRLPGFWSDVLSHPNWFGGAQGYPAVIRLGEGAGANIPQNSAGATDVILLGPGAGNAMAAGNNVIAIGGNVMSQGQPGSHTVGIGNSSLTYLDKTGGGFNGTRNVAVGSLTGHFTTTGYMNTYMGRNAGQCLTTGNNNTVGGYRAGGAGKGPIGLSGRIENHYPIAANRMTAWGASCLEVSMGLGNTGLGAFAGQHLKSGQLNVVIGTGAGGIIDYDLSENGKIMTRPAIAGTYSQTGTTITVNATASGALVGNKVGITFTSGQLNADTGDQQWLNVASVINANSFTVTSPVSKTASGNVTVDIVETAATRTPSGTNTIVGVDAGNASQKMQGTTLMGWQAGYSSEGSDNTFIGQRAGYNNTTGNANTAVGVNAGRPSTTTFSNWTCIGANAVVTGSNQVQLGDSATTTYVYGTVQNRSDERDKADIRDTELGLDFILALRPVDFRWDMRDDYFVENEDRSRVTWPRDGSKKRSRFHHGFIAQEVQATGFEFGGLQDHTRDGGDDVLSIGYDEIIAPLVKAIHELKAANDDLAARVAALEAA